MNVFTTDPAELTSGNAIASANALSASAFFIADLTPLPVLPRLNFIMLRLLMLLVLQVLLRLEQSRICLSSIPVDDF
jgi:hypothetical protein